MNRTCFIVLTLCTLARVDVALATPPSDETRACVAASTQGQTERDEGHLLAAREQLLSCARDSCPVIVKKSCADWLAELDQRTPSVIVRVFETGHGDVTEASVSIDRQPVALDGRAVLLDPGPHTIAVVAPGSLPIARTFLIAEGERARVLSVQLPRRAPSPAEVPAVAVSEPIAASTPTQAPRSTPPEPPHFSVPVGSWVLAGVGVAGLISFAVLGTQAKNELHDLEHSCAPDCTQPQRDPAEQKARLADVSLGVGAAALVGAGAWMLGSWLRHERKHEAVLSLAPTHSGVLATLAARY